MRAAIYANLVSEKYGDKIDRPKEFKQYILNSVEASLKSLGRTTWTAC